MLTRSNYYEWSLLMKVKLQVRFLRDAIKYDGVDYEQDRRALEALCAAVPPEIGATIANKPTAKLAWEAIEARRVGATAWSKWCAAILLKTFAPTSKLKTLPSVSPI